MNIIIKQEKTTHHYSIIQLIKMHLQTYLIGRVLLIDECVVVSSYFALVSRRYCRNISVILLWCYGRELDTAGMTKEFKFYGHQNVVILTRK